MNQIVNECLIGYDAMNVIFDYLHDDVYVPMIKELKPLIYAIPSPLINYDYTFKFGSATYSHIDKTDAQKILKEQGINIDLHPRQGSKFAFEHFATNNPRFKHPPQKSTKIDDGETDPMDDDDDAAAADDDDDDDDDDDMNKSVKRKKSSKLDISWLIMNSQHEFIYEILPTPGMKYMCIYINKCL